MRYYLLPTIVVAVLAGSTSAARSGDGSRWAPNLVKRSDQVRLTLETSRARDDSFYTARTQIGSAHPNKVDILLDPGSPSNWICSSAIYDEKGVNKGRQYLEDVEFYWANLYQRKGNFLIPWTAEYRPSLRSFLHLEGQLYRDELILGNVGDGIEAPNAASIGNAATGTDPQSAPTGTATATFLETPFYALHEMSTTREGKPLPFKGVLSLAWRRRYVNDPETFLEWIVDRLEEPLVGIMLRHLGTASYHFGFFDFNSLDPNAAFKLVPIIDSDGLWDFTAGACSVVGRRGPRDAGIIGRAIISISEPLMILPSPIIGIYLKVLAAHNIYYRYDFARNEFAVPCDPEGPPLPDLVIEVKKTSFTVFGRYLKLEPIAEGSSMCFLALRLPQRDDSFAAPDASRSVFGVPWFKSVYVMLDMHERPPHMGLAQIS